MDAILSQVIADAYSPCYISDEEIKDSLNSSGSSFCWNCDKPCEIPDSLITGYFVYAVVDESNNIYPHWWLDKHRVMCVECDVRWLTSCSLLYNMWIKEK